MNLGVLKNRDFLKISTKEIEKYLSYNSSNEQLSDYRSTIHRWSAHFPKISYTLPSMMRSAKIQWGFIAVYLLS